MIRSIVARMAPEIVIAEPDELAQRFTARFESEARAAIAARGRCAGALPGGSAATVLFPALAQANADWFQVDFFWGDERALAPDHADSNFRLAHELWFVPAGVPSERIHRMPAEALDLGAA